MRKLILLSGAVLALAAPAQAVARPYLGAGEAARVVGRALHEQYTNIEVGSLRARCPRTAQRDFRRCSYTYYDQAGTCFWGDMGVRENWRGYRYRVLYDAKCH